MQSFPHSENTHATARTMLLPYFPTTNLDPIPFVFLDLGLLGSSVRFGDPMVLVGVVVGVTMLFRRLRLPSVELFPSSWTMMISFGFPCLRVGSMYVPNRRSPIISHFIKESTISEEGLRKVGFYAVGLMVNVVIYRIITE